jgi:CheY-like chemotaxis protein
VSRVTGTTTRPLNILIVDDEEGVRRFVERVIRQAGHEATIAVDGPQALDAAAKLESIDLLITDWMMPKMNGDELARLMRVNRPSLKVLYLSGFSDQLFKEKGPGRRDEAFLEKPCSVKSLMDVVALLLSGPSAAANLAPQ